MNVFSQTVDWFKDSSHWRGDYGVPHFVAQHLGYTVETVAIASVIAIPLGLWIGHSGRFRGGAVALTGALRALPTLGVLTWIVGIVGIGLTAPIVSLTILAVPPLLAGAYSGLESVDRETIDAARAIGMTEWQILGKVEVPLALPLIVGGVRSATLQVVATATVGAYIGLGGLGRYLIDGLANHDYPRMAAGSVVIIVIALVLDGVFASLQKIAVGGRASLNPATQS